MNGDLILVPVGIFTTEGNQDSDDRAALKKKNTTLPTRHGRKRPMSVREQAWIQLLEEQEIKSDEH